MSADARNNAGPVDRSRREHVRTPHDRPMVGTNAKITDHTETNDDREPRAEPRD